MRSQGAAFATRWTIVMASGWLAIACTEPGQAGTPRGGRDGAVDAATAPADADSRGDRGALEAARPDATVSPLARGPEDAASAGRGDADVRGRLDAGGNAQSDGGLDAASPADSEPNPQVPCQNSLEPTQIAPALLSEIGLYADIAAKQVADPMQEFTPQFQLWSDGAQKSRWMYLPECGGLIDTQDMDNWSFPVGARAFKEFTVDGKRIETRMLHRHGPGQDDFLFAHYLWNEDESEGHLVTRETPAAALQSPKGTAYDVPAAATCVRCHGARGGESGGLPSRYLGFSAVQLSHDGPGQTMHTLSAGRRLTSPNRAGFRVPGTPVERAALGYLHANCGHCHNDTDDGVAFPASPFVLWLRAADTSVRDTGAYETAIDVAPQGFEGDCPSRIQPGDPGLWPDTTEPVRSCIFERVRQRGTPEQMPPLATRLVHTEGLEILREWILSLPGSGH